MDALLLAAALGFITVHMIDGRPVQINPQEIVRMQSGREDGSPNRTLIDGVRCVIAFTDGHYLSVAETCVDVEDMIGKKL